MLRRPFESALDAMAGLPVELIEGDFFGVGGGRIERYRTGDEGKTQEAFPVSAGGHRGGNSITDAGFKTNGPAWFRHRALPKQDDFFTMRVRADSTFVLVMF